LEESPLREGSGSTSVLNQYDSAPDGKFIASGKILTPFQTAASMADCYQVIVIRII
jgi:hypothetical protein